MDEIDRPPVDEVFAGIGRVNIIIAGKTGAGKSTLINAIFKENLATTGIGRPVTQQIEEITKEGSPLTIVDTRGLELKHYAEIVSDLEREIIKRKNTADPHDDIHIAWLCLNERAFQKCQEGEMALVNMLSVHMPVIVVLTKAEPKESDACNLAKEVARLLPKARAVIRVRAIPEEIDGCSYPTLGLTELIETSVHLVPEAHQNALRASQRASSRQKLQALSVTSLRDSVLFYAINGVGSFQGGIELAERYAVLRLSQSISLLIRDEIDRWPNNESGLIHPSGRYIVTPAQRFNISSKSMALAIGQARMVAAIAHLCGYDLLDERIRNLVTICLSGKGWRSLVYAQIAGDWILEVPAVVLRDGAVRAESCLVSQAQDRENPLAALQQFFFPKQQSDEQAHWREVEAAARTIFVAPLELERRRQSKGGSLS